MEEASVAGESPDRSKKRESSAEATSGSTGPVPEARTEARDPRLAVARDAESSGGSAAGQAGRSGGVDTATKIFSVRDLKAEADSARAPEPEPEGDEESAESGEAAASGGDVSAHSADTSDTADTADTVQTADDAEADDAAADVSDARDAESGPGEDDATDGDAADATGDDRLRAAVAAWVRSGDSTDSGSASGPEKAPEGSGTDDSADSETPDDAEDASASLDADTDSEQSADADADRDAAADGDEDEPADAVPDQPEDAGDDEAGEVEDAAPEDAVPAGSGDSAEPEDTPEDGKGGDGEGAKAAGTKHVDQPTAVFKRPAKPQVDQPTTMLKLGDAAAKAPAKPAATPPAKKPETPETPAKAPETPAKAPETPARPPEAERTSKFVALKPLDEPSAKKPADATAAIPQVGPERTAQQPLPPKPPMDLLAELTNTPPPPVTPVRTIVRRVKIWTPLVLLLAVVFAIAQAVRPLPTPSLALTADDSFTFDGSNVDLPWPSEGQGWMDVNGIGTMGNFGKQTPVAIGSVAKAMTAYIVLKDHPLKPGAEGEQITVDATAEKEGGYDKDGESTLNTVKQGDKLTEKQALSAIMIPSANNIARLLARWDAGSEAAFIKKMNDTAKDLGMKNTAYTDASGLKESTVSTAQDQVLLGNELVKIPALMEITKLPNWVDPSGHKWRNYNALVPYNGALGIKTGTTTKAGGNLLFAATKETGGETVTVVGAILGQHTAPIIDTVNAVSKTAMLGAQDALTAKKILKKGDVVGYVDDQLGGHTPIVLTKDVQAVGWAGLKVKLSFDADDVPHSAKAGTKVGTLTVGDGTSGAVKVPVALQKDLTEPGFGAKLKRIT
ncbi:D-alanyl-D-alanine carboxypeptidase [Streptomyces sp. NPDC057616]|uniref:D-alanyl-D-alanine carboxypeptidase n=1 Tax=Streptomyces sp. NPDC057616 TaxID=3346183 RepID=UPI0036841A57